MHTKAESNSLMLLIVHMCWLGASLKQSPCFQERCIKNILLRLWHKHNVDNASGPIC